MCFFVSISFAATLLTANLVQLATATTLQCLKERSKNCIIPFLAQANPSEEIYLPDLSKKSGLQIVTGNLSIFSERLSRQLGKVEKLVIGPLQLKEIFLKPELTELTAGGNRIEVTTFKTTNADYRLQLLDLRENRLRTLHGFEVLVDLRELHLEGNALETVDLRVFNGMSSLQKLFLERNQLTTVLATELVELPALEYLSLAGNKLTNLEVTNWLLESLTEYDVSSNDLVYINELKNQFPSLHTISLAKNWWHCLWLEDTLEHFSKNSVAIKDQDTTCESKKNVDSICCVPMTDTNITSEDEVSKLDRLKKEQETLDTALQIKIGKLGQTQETKLKKLEKDLNDLERKANKMLPISAVDNLSKPEFVELKKQAQALKASLAAELALWEKQIKQDDLTHRRLLHSISDNRRALDREMKKIHESQAQFGLLRDYVSSKLTKSN